MSLAAIKRIHRKTCDTLYPWGIVFHHVPKCGGSSLSRAFRLRFFLSQVKIEESAAYPAGCFLANALPAVGGAAADCDADTEWRINLFKRTLLAYLLSENVKFVQGHVHFDRKLYETYRHTHRFITLLRDPVERYLSQYYYDYRRHNRNYIRDDLEDFVDTPRGIATGRVFLDYFGETHLGDQLESQQVERAKANLELFAVMGMLDEMDVFRQQLVRTLGVKLRIGHINKGHNKRKPVSDDLYRRIRERCAQDIEIYEYAKRLRIPADDASQLLLERN